MNKAVMQGAIIISAFYAYDKILNIKADTRKKVLLVLFACLLTAGFYIARDINTQIQYGLLFVSMTFIVVLLFKERIDVSISGIALSFGISYGINLLSVALVYTILSILYPEFENIHTIIVAAVIQLAFIFALFRHPRLKNGFPFLKTKWWAGSVGMIIGGAILLAVILIGKEDSDTATLKGSLLVAVVCLIMLILWGLLSLTRLYRETQFERCMAEDAEIIARLRESNEALSKINHSDNKILPAMYMSVNRFLMEAGAELSPELRAKCDEMRDDLAGLMSYRRQFLPQIPSVGGDFPSTGVHTIDAVLDYMRRRALSKQIQFDVEVSAMMQTEGALTGKLELLLSELLDNAIIAVSESDFKRIRVRVTMDNGCPTISISDSGVRFRDETLGKLGEERASTRLDKGGSGIGFMTIFEVVREHKASLILTRHDTRETDFTKTITLLFDGGDRFMIEDETQPQESLISR